MWSVEEADIQIKLFETAELDMGLLAQEGISNGEKANRIIQKTQSHRCQHPVWCGKGQRCTWVAGDKAEGGDKGPA